MSRRRKEPGPKLLGLERAVSSSLDRLKQAVAYQMVIRQADITVEELIACLLPVEDIETLHKAKRLVQEFYSPLVRSHLTVTRVAAAALSASITINLRDLDIAMWNSAAISFQHNAPKAKSLISLLDGLDRIHKRFNQVKNLVAWLDLNASWGAVRYYWPSACALLPNDHDIHRLDGRIFREPKLPIGSMIPLCRETSMTIAEAMLCPLDVPLTPTVNVSIETSTFGLI